ncbi:MAG TPA: bifunctional phosphopantothenoylcysteine decarboxylase/phosphopantothenate--cysteine ligase CoaBC [bacterium]|nr:bifunctional phosphopantothenoylcysteine decarboxylase/phosphopantothenate--cysteine ligase CoaBC [bacterium]
MIPRPTQPKVLLGVTGSIAAYKAVELARLLRPLCGLRVVLTQAGSHLVPVRALRQASGSPVWTSLFKGSNPIPVGTPSGTHPLTFVPHIEYAKGADLVLIAPASADLLAKLAFGIGDDLLSTLCLYAPCPIWVAPAMNARMWNHPAVQANVRTLRARGVVFLGPESGHLACGEVGDGRFAEPAEIAHQVGSFLGNRELWKGKRVVVTAGPTQEALDPVRVLTNRSSGKMGYALAQAALNRGAEVTLITGPVSIPAPVGAQVTAVKTAGEMAKAVLGGLARTDLLIMAAAVADFRPAKASAQKIKKTGRVLTVRLVPNRDILGEVLKKKRKGLVVMGFAAETRDVGRQARAKWARKPTDLLVANRVGEGAQGFESDRNELWVFKKGSVRPVHLGPDLKSRLAERLLELVDLKRAGDGR